MNYEKESLIANKSTNYAGELNVGGRTYRKYVCAMLLDELLDKLETFNPAKLVDFLPYITFLQLGMCYSVSVGLSQLELTDEKLDEIRLWLIEQCKVIHADSETPTKIDISTVSIVDTTLNNTEDAASNSNVNSET